MDRASLIARLEAGETGVVKITAVDCNFNLPFGSWFDGPPFRPMPEWLDHAWRFGVLEPHRYGSTDYAQWLVTQADGSQVNLGPGDIIERLEDGSLRAHPQSDDYAADSERVAALLRAQEG